MTVARTAALLALGAALAGAGVAPVRASAATYDHRVVVATTARDQESDVDGSLERRVNALAERGYELTALVGGDATVLDRLLARRPYVAGLVDHSGLTFAVMARPEGTPGIARTYRLLHFRNGVGVDDVVAPLGAAGFRLALSAHETDVVHVAFERRADLPPVAYRAFRNRDRRSWMDHALADPEVRQRLMRVLPVALDAGLVELGPPQATPGDMQWLSKATHQFETLEAPLRALASRGYQVQLLRTRLNMLDVLAVQPAGATSGTADYDLDDGPWGMACGRGAIAGTAVLPDGDVACITDRSRGGSTPAGLDLTLSPQPTVGGRVMFRGPDCDVRARLTSTRPAAPRIALAMQFEREIGRAAASGGRVVSAMTAVDGRGQMRVVALTSDAAPAVPAGPPARTDEAAALAPDLDDLGQDLLRQREEAVNLALSREPRVRGLLLWLELEGRGPRPEARLLGCVPARVDRDFVGVVARGLLVGPLAGYRLDNRVIVDRVVLFP